MFGGIKELYRINDIIKRNHYCVGDNLNNLNFEKPNIDLGSGKYFPDFPLLDVDKNYERIEYKDICKSYNIDLVKDGYIREFLFSLTDVNACSGSCAFCGSHTIKYNPKENFNNKFEQIKRFYENGFNSCMLLDCNLSDNIVLNPLYEYIQKNNIKMNFLCGFKLKDITKEKINILESIGCKILNVGIETVEEEHRLYIGKNLKNDKLFDSLDLLKKSNMFIMGNFILYMPYFALDEIQQTKEFIDRNLVDDYISSIYFVADNSPFVTKRNKFQIKTFQLRGFKTFCEKNRFDNMFSLYSHIAKTIPNLINSEININNFYKCLPHLIFMLFDLYKNKNLVVEQYRKIVNVI